MIALTIVDLPVQRHKDSRDHKAAVVLLGVENNISKRVLSLHILNCFWLSKLDPSNVQLLEIRETYFCTKKPYQVCWF